MSKGQILKIHSDFYYVLSEGQILECKLREVLKKQGEKPLVGDFVLFDNNAISEIFPRNNYIPRPAVANVDQVIIVSALKNPELSFSQLNRYIAFAEYYGQEAVLCFNKEDLLSDNSLLDEVLNIYKHSYNYRRALRRASGALNPVSRVRPPGPSPFIVWSRSWF